MEEPNDTNQLWPTIVMLTGFIGLFGAIYPFLVTLVLQNVFPYKANGSLIMLNHEVKGSELIGQPFLDPSLFWSRPSVTELFPFNAEASKGSNLSATNVTLLSDIKKRVEMLTVENKDNRLVPVDLATASASGLDPHISVAAAKYQVSRVASARNVETIVIDNIVNESVENKQFGLLGESRINVVKLNLKLEERLKT
jgi:potassium-transporting ATPase KdpC subunit